MSKNGLIGVTVFLAVLVVILLIVVVYLVSIVQMNQFSVLASNEKVNVTYLNTASRTLAVNYAGYLSIRFNSTAPVLLRIIYEFGAHNYTATYVGSSGTEHLAVLPSKVTLDFNTASISATVRYTVILQY
jgi:hypothetical protein